MGVAALGSVFYGYKENLAVSLQSRLDNLIVDLKNNVIPRAVSEHKFSSLCEQARGTLGFDLVSSARSLTPAQALIKAPSLTGIRDDDFVRL
jgi:hypothetical protein